ncbi:uncharacterized protein LOC105211870 [Zeugodacus cucurbitae]|uniref:uncharacterized protein LOC105211870 n=1 Tax=Zeugodacus cucurbitae TaxID=28588 RepID=UPI0023D96000|nr:uncharacterized protein LOC105211870 [Zeugodacus cucurbitae]
MQRRLNKLTVLLLVLSCAYNVQGEITILPDVLYYNLTTTSRADLFHMHHLRQFGINVKELEQSLVDFKDKYHARLDVIGYNIELLETKLEEVDNKLNPLMLLGDINDYCVNKHRAKLPQIAQLTIKMKECTLKGTNSYNGFVSGAEATVRNLKNYYTSNFATAVNECKKKHANQLAERNYTQCISTAVTNAATKTYADTNVFQNQMKTAECNAAMKIREVFDCYNLQVFSTFNTIGEVMGLVENCIAGQEFCPSCGDDTVLTKGRCPYHLSWHLADSDMTSEKINNPFKGIAKTTPCLQVNFITKGIAV